MDSTLAPTTSLHHSYSDWHFQGWNWPRYVTSPLISPPTSLRAQNITGTLYQGHSILTSHPRLPELMIVNNINFHATGTGIHADYFRAQAYPIGPTFYPENCYYMLFAPSLIRFGYYINGGFYQIAYVFISPPLALDTWHKYRWAAWDLPSHASPTTLAYFFDIWDVDHWATYLSGTTAAQLWSAMTTNLFGIWLQAAGGYNQPGVTIDDTEIWVPLV